MHDIKPIKTRVPITDKTYRTLSNGNRVPTFTKMVRQLNKTINNA